MYELSRNIKLLYSTPVTCHLSPHDRIPFVVQCFIINFQHYPDLSLLIAIRLMFALAGKMNGRHVELVSKRRRHSPPSTVLLGSTSNHLQSAASSLKRPFAISRNYLNTKRLCVGMVVRRGRSTRFLSHARDPRTAGLAGQVTSSLVRPTTTFKLGDLYRANGNILIEFQDLLNDNLIIITILCLKESGLALLSRVIRVVLVYFYQNCKSIELHQDK